MSGTSSKISVTERLRKEVKRARENNDPDMRKMMAGEVPTTTFAASANYKITKVEEGLVEVTGTPLFAHTNAFGGVHGGWYGVLLDTCLTCAIITGKEISRPH